MASVKTGMLASSATVAAVARWAAAGKASQPRRRPGARGLDRASACSTRVPSRSYLELLLPHALVVTPNIREAALLADTPVEDVDGMVRAAHRLADTGVRAVVVKGGHLAGDRAPDVVLFEGAVHVLDGPRVTSRNDHGTGCTLSAATAALLALGHGPARRAGPGQGVRDRRLARARRRGGSAQATARSTTSAGAPVPGPVLTHRDHARARGGRGATSRSLVARAPRRRPTGGRVTPQDTAPPANTSMALPPGTLPGPGVGGHCRPVTQKPSTRFVDVVSL